jgi:hypothetical protein
MWLSHVVLGLSSVSEYEKHTNKIVMQNVINAQASFYASKKNRVS